jgi:uncharacterized DUF497 family protein
MPEFQWDERKRLANLAKHKLDFFDAQPLFDGRDVLTNASAEHEEQRFTTTGTVDGRFYTVVWTLRGETIRLISFRRARNAEKRAYRNSYG